MSKTVSKIIYQCKNTNIPNQIISRIQSSFTRNFPIEHRWRMGTYAKVSIRLFSQDSNVYKSREHYTSSLMDNDV